MVKFINVALDEEDFTRLKELKGKMSWADLLKLAGYAISSKQDTEVKHE